MVKRPYRIANTKATKKQPRTTESLNDHNAEAHAYLKAKSIRAKRRQDHKYNKTLVKAINDGRWHSYDASKERVELRDVERVRRLDNPRNNHLFSLGDSWPDKC